MGRIVYGPLAEEVHGKVAGLIFSTWRGKAYVKSVSSVYQQPQALKQSSIRARMAECSKYWYDTLTQAQRDGWNTYAPTVPHYTQGYGEIIKKAQGNPTGFNAFVRNNCNCYSGGVLAFGQFRPDAPIGVTPPDVVTSFTAIWDAPNNRIYCTWAAGTVPGFNIRIWARSLNNHIHGQICAIFAVTDLAAAFTDIKGANGASIPLTSMPGMYEVQADVIDLQGQDSQATNVIKNIAVA